ncbi:MAG: adenosine deaminase family protein [Myxococcales bacterium]|nr:adenosine deaminase family protein [Myxococcales bacterium]
MPEPLPLADLHRHLDGSLRRATLVELAGAQGLTIADDFGFRPGMGLPAALACFDTTLAVLQTPAAVERVAREICEDAAADGVTTLELRFAPQLHLRRGASMASIVDAALAGCAGRAGLVLCGLYGEPPAVLEALVELARARVGWGRGHGPGRGVVGIDLAGGPAPGHAYRLEDYAPAFVRARDLGLGRTVHAGEGRPPAEIRVAVERLLAQRIGHGTTLLDDPAVTELVCARGVTLEACVTSNLHTGVIARIEDHPIARWLERGVRVCINTDNTLMSGVDAQAEHARVAGIPGMTAERLRQAVAHGHAAAFGRGPR